MKNNYFPEQQKHREEIGTILVLQASLMSGLIKSRWIILFASMLNTLQWLELG